MKLRKQILATVICVIMILCSLPLTSFAATISGFNVINFTVPENKDAGLGATLKIFRDVTDSTNYKMVIALPDGVDISKLRLAWDHTEDITVKSGSSSGTTVTSGNVALPDAGNSITLNVSASIKSGGRTSTQNKNFTFTNAKRSADVKSIYINIDETVTDKTCTGTETCTINRMNSDDYHEKTCYGTFDFGGKTYYLSMKGRGNTTWKQNKKPYNFTTFKDTTWKDKKKTSLVDGVESKKWSLLANYSDSTLLRNKTAYDMAEKLGIGLKSRFVDVWLNGEFLGNYLLTPKTDYNSPDDGFLLELDNKKETLTVEQGGDPQFFLNGIKTYSSFYNAFTVKDYNDEIMTVSDIQECMQTTLNAIMQFDSTEYLKYVDIDSWAKMYLMHELCKSYDIISGSMFMYRNSLNDGDKLIAGPLWDMDNALGRQQECNYCGVDTKLQHSSDEWYIDCINTNIVNSLFQYLGKHSEFMERVYQVYNEYKSDFDNILTNLQNEKDSIADSRILNFKRWNVNQTQYNVSRYTSNSSYGTSPYNTTMIATTTYDNYFQNLNTYLSMRLNWFADKLTVSTVPTCTVSGGTVFYAGDTLTLTATATDADAYSWQYSTDGVIWNIISGATSKTYSTTVTADMDKWQYRCVAIKYGVPVATTNKRVAQVNTSSVAYGNAPAALHVHKFKDAVTGPTCTAEGYTTHTCKCGESYIDTYTDMIPHEYEDGKCIVCSKYQPIKKINLKAGEYISNFDLRNLTNQRVVFSFDYYLGNCSKAPTVAGYTLSGGMQSFYYSGKPYGSFIPKITAKSDTEMYIWNIRLTVDGKEVALTDEMLNQSTATITDTTYDKLPSDCGDVNNDGEIDILDFVRLKSFIAGELVSVNFTGADVNNDKTVDATDLALLKNIILGIA